MDAEAALPWGCWCLVMLVPSGMMLYIGQVLGADPTPLELGSVHLTSGEHFLHPNIPCKNGSRER